MVNKWPRKFLHNPWALPRLLETSSKAEQNKHTQKKKWDFTVGELKNKVGRRQEEKGTAREEEVLEGELPAVGFPGALGHGTGLG